MNTLYDFKAKDINGKEENLNKYKGKVSLIVNVASKCGLTPQYQGLQDLYNKYHDKGFEILGFPSNDFAGQEPGTEDDIKTFCSTKYDVSFDMFSKVKVKGNDKIDIYNFLTSSETNKDGSGEVSWNFQKYLIDKNGDIVKTYHPQTEPKDIAADIEKELSK